MGIGDAMNYFYDWDHNASTDPDWDGAKDQMIVEIDQSRIKTKSIHYFQTGRNGFILYSWDDREHFARGHVIIWKLSECCKRCGKRLTHNRKKTK